MTIIDTHTHYDDEAYENDRDELLTNLFSENVSKIIAIGCSVERSQKAVQLSEKYENIFAAVGIHPQDVLDLPENYLNIIKEMTENKKVVAIGEIGLDYHYDEKDIEKQKKCFAEQIFLANELSLPVVVHSRDATEDTIEILKNNKPDKAVIHCFSGSAETAKKYIDMGFFISFTGVLTFKNAKKAIESCRIIPIERLMLETDCPYMAPSPFRGQRCDSSMIYYIAEKVAEIKRFETEQVLEICNKNAVEFFGLEK